MTVGDQKKLLRERTIDQAERAFSERRLPNLCSHTRYLLAGYRGKGGAGGMG